MLFVVATQSISHQNAKYSAPMRDYRDSLPGVRSVIEGMDNCRGDFRNGNEAPNNPRERQSNTTE